MTELLLVTKDLMLYDQLSSESSIEYRLSRVEFLEEASGRFEQNISDVLLIDIENIESQELDYISYFSHKYPSLITIILTTIDSIDAATRAIQSGALYYLIKPVTCKIIEQSISRVTQAQHKKKADIEAEKQMMYDLIGGSPAMEKTMKLIMKVAPSSATVFLGGENGTGKEFFAQLIHRRSNQTNKFVPVNCGAIPESLFESELFGHKKGSFTGADKDKKGLALEADGGTLFLDEVGELSPANQVKLLRFLQEKSFKPVGANEEIKVDCRIISATNRNLNKMVKEGTFREDLYYRLHVFPVTLPPLRERKETIPNLIRLFILRNSEKLNKVFRGFTKGAEFALYQHNYPGNIRELENIIEHAAIMSETPIITEADLPEYLLRETHKMIEDKREALPQIAYSDKAVSETLPIEEGETTSQINSPFVLPLRPLESVEKDYIRFALEACNNNHSEAAKKLGVSRSTLWRKLKEEEKDAN